MMGPSSEKLLSIGSPALCAEKPRLRGSVLEEAGSLGRMWMEILVHKNGFYAFESALHVFPAGCPSSCIDLDTWNGESGWRTLYGDILKGHVFFTEDIFGVQFTFFEDHVSRFDPETAHLEKVSVDIEAWASRILDNYDYETGHPLAHEWQEKNGPLPHSARLLPKVPFVLGGAYEVENLYTGEALKGMEFRADIWRQIRDLPDRTKINLRVTR